MAEAWQPRRQAMGNAEAEGGGLVWGGGGACGGGKAMMAGSLSDDQEARVARVEAKGGGLGVVTSGRDVIGEAIRPAWPGAVASLRGRR